MVFTPRWSAFPPELDVPARIDRALAQYASFGPGCPSRLAQAIRHSLLAGGKRLRPQMVLLAAQACGGAIQPAMPAAVAVEMAHTYSLIHDDLPAMDDDDLRRGRPSCHVAFGEATAILAGDALLARAFEVLARELQPPEVAAACCAALAEAVGATAMVGGQADDLAAERTPGDLDLLQSIHDRKTGAMLVVSLKLGGLVAKASPQQLRDLELCGTSLGLAFQIADDLLDEGGSEARVGKRTGKDQRRGKLTFPALLGVPESRRRAAALAEEACRALSPWGTNAAGLQRLARHVVERIQ